MNEQSADDTEPVDESDAFYDDYDEEYENPDFITVSLAWSKVRLLGDDIFNLSQINQVCMVDPYLRKMENEMIREYVDTEKTPQSASVLAAFSQMWVFAVYETLRRWRHTAYEFQKWSSNGAVAGKLAKWAEEPGNLAAQQRAEQLKEYARSEQMRLLVAKQLEHFKPFFDELSELRITLAKHVVPGRDSSIALTPGYARIDYGSSSMAFQVLTKDGYTKFVSRRDLSNDLAAALLTLPTTVEES